MHVRQFLVPFLVCLMFVSISSAQTAPQDTYRYPRVSSSFNLRNWNKENGGLESSIMEITTPVVILYPVMQNLALAISSGAVFSSLDEEAESELNGVTDTQLRSFYTMADDTVFVGLGLNLPSGRSSLSKDEWEVSKALSENVMDFDRNRLGGGLDIDLSGGLTRPFGPMILGGGIEYLVKGKYDYLEEEESEYKPGNELSLNAGADLAVSRLILQGDFIYSIYSSSELDGEEVFDEGSKLSAEGKLFYPLGPVILLASARDIIRSDVEQLGSKGPILVPAEKRSVGDQLDLGGAVYLKIGSRLILKGLAETRLIGEDENGEGDASAAAFGAGLRITPLTGMVMDLTGKYLTGEADNGDTSLDGFAATFSLRWEFWQ
jgi:hypothetical protein